MAGILNLKKTVYSAILNFYKKYLKEELHLDNLIVRFKALNTDEDNRLFTTASNFIESNIKGFKYQRTDAKQSEQQYYKRLQFKIFLLVIIENMKSATEVL